MKTWITTIGIGLIVLAGCQSTPDEVEQQLALQHAESSSPSQENPVELAIADEAMPADDRDAVHPEQQKFEAPTVAEEEELEGLVRAEELERWGGVFEFTGRTRVKGVLQIYWHGYFETPDNAPNRALLARFLVGAEEAEGLAEFPDDAYDRTPSILILHLGRDEDDRLLTGREVSRLAEELVKSFEEIPESFFPYQEGHVEQPGILTLEGLSSLVECDAPYTFVKFESFQPLPLTDETRTFTANVLAESDHRGCGTEAPWEESFVLRDGQAIFAEPDENSNIVAEPSMPVVFKIRTVNDDWMKVYSYPDPEVRGFVRSDQLEPVN